MVKLSAKQQRIIKAKLKGAKNKDIGAVEYPQATPQSQAVLVSRELKKEAVAQYYGKELSQQLNDNFVTKSQYIMNIGLAMTADKQNQFTGEISPDITARLQGNKQAERFLKFEEESTEDNLNTEGLDDMELIGAVFKKPGNK